MTTVALSIYICIYLLCMEYENEAMPCLTIFVRSMWQNFMKKQQIKHIATRLIVFFISDFWFLLFWSMCVFVYMLVFRVFLSRNSLYRLLFGVSIANSFTLFPFIKINLECIIVFGCMLFFFSLLPVCIFGIRCCRRRSLKLDEKDSLLWF